MEKQLNQRIKVSANFHLDEFVDPHTYLTRKDKGKKLIDKRLFEIAQKYRCDRGKSTIINNWWHYLSEYKGDPLEFLNYCENQRHIRCWSGLRTKYCSFGGPAHRYGKAIDLVGDTYEYYNLLKANPQYFYSIGVRRIEDPHITPGWHHVDTWEHNTRPNSIRVVDLKVSTETITW